MFGGDMEIVEFRSTAVKDDIPITRLRDDSHRPTEVKVISFESIRKTEKLQEIHNSTSTNAPLRMKREKPLKREQNNLEGLLGIKRTAGNR
jgi:hypothetical protein